MTYLIQLESGCLARRGLVGRRPRPGLHDQRSLPIQIRDEIRALIAAGTLRPGDPLHGEAELAVRFSVARPTLREALKLLEQDGEVEVRHGLGRFVASAIVRWPITRLESVGNMLHAMGSTVATQVVSVDTDEASEDEAVELGLQVGSRVVRLLRIRLLDGRPAVYSLDVVSGWIVENDVSAVDWTGSLRAYLEARGAYFASSRSGIRAVTLPRSFARAVNDKNTSAPWLLLTQTTFAPDGRAALYSLDYHRGGAFTFNVLRRSAETGKAGM